MSSRAQRLKIRAAIHNADRRANRDTRAARARSRRWWIAYERARGAGAGIIDAMARADVAADAADDAAPEACPDCATGCAPWVFDGDPCGGVEVERAARSRRGGARAPAWSPSAHQVSGPGART